MGEQEPGELLVSQPPALVEQELLRSRRMLAGSAGCAWSS